MRVRSPRASACARACACARLRVRVCQALEDRDDAAVLSLISEKSERVNTMGGPYFSTPLGWAALLGNASLASALLDAKADVSIAAQRGSYPLHMATWNGDYPQVPDRTATSSAQHAIHAFAHECEDVWLRAPVRLAIAAVPLCRLATRRTRHLGSAALGRRGSAAEAADSRMM
eukprot:4352831-Pleurochrysis_carterae.AAC.1